MYVIETRIKTRSNKTIWMPYKQYRTTNGIENFQKRHQYLFDAGGAARHRQRRTSPIPHQIRQGAAARGRYPARILRLRHDHQQVL